MKEFEYIIKDSLGIHARPAGLLVNLCKQFESKIDIEKNGKRIDASRLISLMGLGVKCGDIIKIYIDGPDENDAQEALKKFLNENL